MIIAGLALLTLGTLFALRTPNSVEEDVLTFSTTTEKADRGTEPVSAESPRSEDDRTELPRETSKDPGKEMDDSGVTRAERIARLIETVKFGEPEARPLAAERLRMMVPTAGEILPALIEALGDEDDPEDGLQEQSWVRS